MSEPNIEELERLYNEASAGSVEPDMVVTTTELARKHMSDPELAAIDAFLAAHPGNNWWLDRETLVVTEMPDDEEDPEGAD